MALPLLLVTPLPAEQSPARDTLLARLTAEALAANPGLASADALARAADARVRPAGALPDPMLSVGVMDLVLPSFAFRRSDFTEVDIEASQEFPWPGTQRARTQAARATATALVAETQGRRREILARVATMYYRLRYAVSARATLTRQRGLLGTAVEIATTRYATGSVPQSDPLQARLARARLDTEEAMLVEEDAILRAELRALRNVTEEESLAVEPVEVAPALLTELQEAVSPIDTAGALEGHPRLAARRAALEAARSVVRVEALGARPDFTITARYGARPIAEDFFSAFVGLRVPLWAGRKQHRLTDAAREDVRAADQALREEQRRIEAELRSVRAGIAAGRERLRLLVTQVVPAARETAEATLRSYRVGQLEFLTLLAVEDARYRAELEVASVASDLMTRLVMLEQLLGRGSEP
ncbi:MAG TPA: TolC family protein [Gemmatimonadales bacterium]